MLWKDLVSNCLWCSSCFIDQRFMTTDLFHLCMQNYCICLFHSGNCNNLSLTHFCFAKWVWAINIFTSGKSFGIWTFLLHFQINNFEFKLPCKAIQHYLLYGWIFRRVMVAVTKSRDLSTCRQWTEELLSIFNINAI